MGKMGSTLGKVGKMGAGAALGGPAGAGAAGAEIGAEAAMEGGSNILSNIGQSISGKLKSMLPNIAKGQLGSTGGAAMQDTGPSQRPPIPLTPGIQQSPSTVLGVPSGLNPQEQQDIYDNRWKKYYQ